MHRILVTAAIGLLGAAATPAAVDWPGGAPMRPADAGVPLGPNLSGLAIDGAAGLWAVRDTGSLVHLDRTDAGWKRTPGDSGERVLHYPGGQGSPDSEAVTTVATDQGAVYVAAERDNNAPAVSRNSILRFDTSGTGALTATREWKLEPIFAATPANTGVESIAWIPDSVFVTMGFNDGSGRAYAPAEYPDHGSGLFATTVETRGDIVFLALHGDGQVTQVGKAATGLDAIMDLSWNAERQELWATCDNFCKGQIAVLQAGDGAFQVAAIVRPPAGMEALNDEGFAIVSTCANSVMLAVWSDDGASGGTSLREATLPCDRVALLAATPGPSTTHLDTTSLPTSTATATATATQTTAATQPPNPTHSSSRSVWYLGAVALAVGGGAVLARLLRRR